MPRSVYQPVRWSIQYWCHSSSVPGSTKNSISICSNSRVRKMKLPGRDLVAERLADLADAERRLLPRGAHHVGEVHEDALRGLRAQVVQAGLVLDRAEVGLEHHVEVARLGPRALRAAVRAGDVGQAVLRRPALARLELLLEVVGPEALVAALALGQRVGEDADVTGGDPDLARQDHRGVQADDVVPALDDGAPPLLLDVLLELDAQGPVVPGGAGAAVDLAGREDEAPSLAEVDDLVEAGGVVLGGAVSLTGDGAPSGWRSAVDPSTVVGDRQRPPTSGARTTAGWPAPRTSAPLSRVWPRRSMTSSVVPTTTRASTTARIHGQVRWRRRTLGRGPTVTLTDGGAPNSSVRWRPFGSSRGRRRSRSDRRSGSAGSRGCRRPSPRGPHDRGPAVARRGASGPPVARRAGRRSPAACPSFPGVGNRLPAPRLTHRRAGGRGARRPRR